MKQTVYSLPSSCTRPVLGALIYGIQRNPMIIDSGNQFLNSSFSDSKDPTLCNTALPP